ncbi:hypothetical protein LEP1GSC103_1912 [Leptospira borgpetersenii serovar Javanica str. UI 09931]|uniref:Uncharacterized protein n=1 Tax=Leptospira borgpetersenii serovar Javanica str. UI 09931 TaxID=1049767 RepID=A0AAV3J8L9_LEPBO|nr:hypothetical protein LEP1GSC103_1912 [Leptospira borgpetersenii serovar Javanica str. UI 09931]
MKEVELKKKLESITFQVTLGVVQKIREGDLEFVSHLPGLFPYYLESRKNRKGLQSCGNCCCIFIGPVI